MNLLKELWSIPRTILKYDSRCYEYYGDRWRIFIGNIARWTEGEGGYRVGSQINFEIGLGDHTGEFDDELYDHKNGGWLYRHHYLARWISFMVFRWGISVIVRGREIDADWSVPRWREDEE